VTEWQPDPAECEAPIEQQQWVVQMAIHKRILEWQAAHPKITWVGWGIVWAIVLALLFWPRTSE
jgi:hypothetical protein